MAHGGKRPGAGRPPGSINKASREMREAIAADGVTPLEYLLTVMRDESSDQSKRIEAAKSAAPYVHARLSAVDFTGTVHSTHEQLIEQIERDSAASQG